MIQRRKLLASVTVVVTVLFSTTLMEGGVSAHQEFSPSGQWQHWNKSGAISLSIADYAGHRDEAEAAIGNHAATVGVNWVRTGGSAEVTVFDGDYGNTGWCGNATLYWDGNGHFTSTDAKYNSDPSMSCGQTDAGFIQGIFCQEIGHDWGQDHHNVGGSCRGLTYFGGAGNGLSSHDADDFSGWYANHPIT